MVSFSWDTVVHPPTELLLTLAPPPTNNRLNSSGLVLPLTQTLGFHAHTTPASIGGQGIRTVFRQLALIFVIANTKGKP